jgi:putative ATPase
MADAERGLAATRVEVDPQVIEGVARLSDGDLRRALNALETLVLSMPMGGRVDVGDLETFARERQIRYDADEDEHYDTVSAFIKSVRGSDPDAALYWLAKMVVGGEDPRFIARRLVILASEDVGLADSRGIGVAVAAQQAVEFIGMPEAEYPLAHATLFLALAPKSNSIGTAFGKSKEALRNQPVQPVPLWLRDSSTKAAKGMGYGEGYLYSHEFPEGVSGQEYMLKPMSFYEGSNSGAEDALLKRLERLKALKRQMREE